MFRFNKTVFWKNYLLAQASRSSHTKAFSKVATLPKPAPGWRHVIDETEKNSHLLCYFRTKVAFRGFVIRRLFRKKKKKKHPFHFDSKRHQSVMVQ